MIALHPDVLKNVWEFWTSVGTKLRASLSVTVTIAMPVFAIVKAATVTSVTTGLEIIGSPQTHVATTRIGGTVTDNANGPANPPQSQTPFPEVLTRATSWNGSGVVPFGRHISFGADPTGSAQGRWTDYLRRR